MRSSGPPVPGPWRLLLAVAFALLVGPTAQAQQSAPGGIYTCTDDKGRRLTSDRPIAECTSKDQQILNRDGSVKGVHPPVPTAEERAEREARERKANAERMAHMEAVRRDKNLMARYRDEAAHRKAREAALESVRLAIKATADRLKELKAERVPLNNEAEFYKGKPLPPKLKTQIEANDTAVEAQRDAATNQQSELDRVNRIYDGELSRLQKLWAGAVPGTLGPITTPAPKASASAPSR